MALNLATLNARGLRNPSKCARLLGELLNLSVNVTAVQETHFTCAADCRVLEGNYVILSAFGKHSSVGISQLIGCGLNADVNIVLADDGSRLVVANVAVKSFVLRVAAVYVPNIAAERVSFFRLLVPFLDEMKRIVVVGDWNAILDPKIGRIGRGARESGRYESNLIDFMAWLGE